MSIVPSDDAWRRRRLRYAKWRRFVRWEYWPTLPIYLPVIPVIFLAALRHRSMRCVLLANPAMPSSGLVEDSKGDILEGLQASGRIADFLRFDAGDDAAPDRVRRWMSENALTFPVVLKPDAGERGRGVVIAKSAAEMSAYLSQVGGEVLAQEYVRGIEYGVFYERHPDKDVGRITGLTHKGQTTVTGDDSSTLEQLILNDARAVAQAPIFLQLHSARLDSVPAEGEEIVLNALGTHSQGSLFLDASHELTDALTAAVDQASRCYAGFHIGRYDVRVPDLDSLRRGEHWKILELNGVASEPTHMYDPSHSIFYAWKCLSTQWWRAYSYGAANRRKGHKLPTWGSLFAKLRDHRRRLKG